MEGVGRRSWLLKAPRALNARKGMFELASPDTSGGIRLLEGDYGRAVNITRIKRKLETISAGTAKTECGRK